MHLTLLNALYKSSSKDIQKVIKSATKRKVSEKGHIVKKYNTENKTFFGDLLQTTRQKNKERSTAAAVPNVSVLSRKSTKDDQASELWWWSKSRYLTLIKFKNHKQVEKGLRKGAPKDLAFQVDGDSSSEILPSSDCLGETTIPVEDIKEDDASTKGKSSFYRTSLKLPSIIVKNLTTFPLENEKKESAGWSMPVDEIMSLTVDGETGSKTKSVLTYPSVTRILNATMSEASVAALQKWKENLIAKLGEEGFKKHQEGLLACGKMFHSTIHRFLSGTPYNELSMDSTVEGCWHSLQNVINDVSSVKVLESHVVHNQLMYRGFLDCIAMYKDQPLLIEWKRSDKQKPHLWNTYDAPIQLAAYLGALNFDNHYDFKVRKGLVVVAYTDGSPAHVHKLGVSECQKYWRAWLERLQKYWNIVEGN